MPRSLGLFRIPGSMKEAGLNFLSSASSILFKCAATLSMLQLAGASDDNDDYAMEPSDGSGCAPCNCAGCCPRCYQKEVCKTYEKMGKKLLAKSFELFDTTLDLIFDQGFNASSAQDFFNTQMLSDSKRIMKNQRHDVCPNPNRNNGYTPQYNLGVMVLPLALTLSFASLYMKNLFKDSNETEHKVNQVKEEVSLTP